MPLQSQLFADNAGLQACLVKDSAHLTPGSKGKSVELVQAALVRMRFLEPGDALAEAGSYGTRTAAAVLQYKQMFNVINFSYQKKADNIVGKMTIGLLDAHMCVLDSFAGQMLREPSDRFGVLFQRPDRRQASAAPAKAAFTRTAFAPAGRMDAPVIGDAAPPAFASFPQDMLDTIRRSNQAKVVGTPSMYPFVGNHEGPIPDDELAKRFAHFETDTKLVFELYNRMKPFGIWGLVKTIRAMSWGPGSRGMFCHLHDHAVAFAHMQALSTGPVDPPNPYLNDISKVALPVMHSRFCKDAFNVHGERDSWREIVKSGPGLHICVTNAIGRARTDENYPASDFHIDEIQQGQFCSNGVCIPILNGQTIGHLKTVGPWLAKQPGEWLKKHLPKK